MINTFDKLKETFVRDADTYINKTIPPSSILFRGGEYGVIDSSGATWRDHRRFAISNLRDFGLGKNLMQEKILIEVQDIFSNFDEKLAAGESDLEIPPVFDRAVANVINQVLFGYRFDKDGEEFRSLKNIIEKPSDLFGRLPVFLAMNIKFIEKILPTSMYVKPFTDWREETFAFFNKQIAEHKREVDLEDLDSENTDYVEAYLKEQRKREIQGDTESSTDIQLVNMCIDLWFGGLATTTNTTTWAISFVLHNLEVQDKIHEELDRIIGSDRLITTADKNDLPYLNAYINSPLNVPHATTRDTIINGYSIPRGTGVVAQISTVMNDEKTFPDHKSFKPERFIDENGKLKKVEELIPFSIGKRQCLGEGLARMELFLFLANFFNRYQISPSKNGLPSMDKSSISRIEPRLFSAVLKRRR
ncbi:unnamed protein product [Caenorhabditis nigoni]